MNLTLAEQETCLLMSADNRNEWTVSCDDPVMQRRMESIGAILTGESKNGVTKFYILRADQITFRKGKRELSPERKAQLAERMRAMRATLDTA